MIMGELWVIPLSVIFFHLVNAEASAYLLMRQCGKNHRIGNFDFSGLMPTT